MRRVKFSFQEDPATFTARWLISKNLDPIRTMIVAPTQRFKTYLAASLLTLQKSACSLSPHLTTSSDLIGELIARTERKQANPMEQLTLLHGACVQTGEIMELYPDDFLKSYPSFLRVARRLLRTFEELGREEIDLESRRGEGHAGSSFVQKQLKVLHAIRRNYYRAQQEQNLFDPSFLTDQVRYETIQAYFEEIDELLLVSPLSLTAFEQRVLKAVDDRLTVMYQDTDDYDFSRILTFHHREQEAGGQEPAAGSNGSTRFFEASSRMEQLMLTLSLIDEALQCGTEPQDIAVLNSDSLFGRMLYDALTEMGIEVNYSEGLPVRSSPLYQFLVLVARFFSSKLDSGMFLELLKNEFFIELLGQERGDEYHSLYETIRDSILKNRIFELPSLGTSLIKRNESLKGTFERLKCLHGARTFGELYSALEKLFASLSGRKAYAFYAVRDVLLDTSLMLQDLSIGLRDAPFDVLLQHVKPERYALPGVYMRGVQILGLLESRAMGFSKVIVPSFNEGFFPVKRENDILLPAEVRDYLGLPSLLDREEMGFYYLKRVVDLSQDTCFITLTDQSGDVDVMSRYANLFGKSGKGVEKRMRCTLPARGGDASIQRLSIGQPSLTSAVQSFSRMDIASLKGCEVQYFIARNLGLYEPEMLVREIEPSIIGLQVHRIFNDLYREVDFDHLDASMLEENLDVLLDKHFREGLFYSREEDLVKRILGEKLLASLRHDVERFREGYRVCPEFIERSLSAEVSGGRYTITGRIDRVDRSPAGAYVLIDYKTGSIPAKAMHFEEAGFSEVQLGFYGLLLRHTEPGAAIESLCYFDLSGDNRMRPIVEGEAVYAYLDGFEAHLIDFLDALNGKSGLSLAASLDTCAYCSYYNICRIYEE